MRLGYSPLEIYIQCSSTLIVKTGRLVGMKSQVWVDASAVDPDNDSTLTQTMDCFSPV